MQKVHLRGAVPPVNYAESTPSLAVGLRMALAIFSLIFMIPLAAITTANSGLLALVVVGLVVLGINIAFNRNR